MRQELVIDGFHIHDDAECYVIAEIGANHQGDLNKAKDLIKTTHDSGVNAVKFQKKDNRAAFTRRNVRFALQQ